jgi:hypothetical protein
VKGKGLRSERETIVNFNEAEESASIWTASETVYRRLLKRLGRAYLTEDGERHAVFTFPKELISLPRVKAKRTMSDSHKAKLMAGRTQRVREKGQSGVSLSGDGNVTAPGGARCPKRLNRLTLQSSSPPRPWPLPRLRWRSGKRIANRQLSLFPEGLDSYQHSH